MILNLDFHSKEDVEEITEEEKSQFERYFSGFSTQEKITENTSLEDFKILTNLRKNILSWYEFKENASILELNPNFGEITGFLCDVAKDVVAISNSKTKGIAISNRLINKKNLEVIVGNLENIKIEKTFDYVVIIGEENQNKFLEKLKFAKEKLKPQGKILVAFDNKFGMKYWTGVKENLKNQYDSILGETEKIGIASVENFLEASNLKSKVYYPLPDYKITNVIFSDEYLPNSESMMSRNLVYFGDEEYCNFSQRQAYIELINENPEYFKLFANSYFLEIAEEVNSETKYVNFEIYRRNEFNIKTIIKEDFVYKSANEEVAQKHINDISKNIEIIKKKKIDTLDSFDGKQIISRFAKNAISLDKYIVETYKSKGKAEAISVLKDFLEKVLGKFKIISKPKSTIFDKYKIEENFEDLKYIKDGLIDLCTQNCFYIDNKMYIYDQEWYEENVPVEFIVYRNIFYSNNLAKYISKEELYEEFGITKYIKTFEELDNVIQNSLRNSYVWSLHVKSVNSIGKKDREIAEKNEEIETLKKKILEEASKNNRLHKSTQDLNSEVETYKNENNRLQKQAEQYHIMVQDLNNQLVVSQNRITDFTQRLQIIEKSMSWRITKPFRYISWVLNFKNKLKLVDRLMPPGSNMRAKHEKKKNKKILAKLAKSFYPYTDKATAKRWALLVEKINDEPKNRTSNTDYDKWMNLNDPSEEDFEYQRSYHFSYEPKISIVTPLYNTPTDFFRDLLFFMHEQTYSNWELCLADGSPEPLTQIQKMIEKESRVKYVFLGKNKGISENTNEAIKLATGDYIGLLDHDDYLSKDCLFEVVKAINENRNIEFIYTDEDKASGVGEERYDAYFKPDFAIDTLRSQNYICHFSVFKKNVMDKLKGFRKDFDGAQDYDIFLRMSEIVKEKNIKHIPKILYHWRIHKASTAMQGSAKPWAFEAGKKALEDHIKRVGLKGIVKNGVALGTYEIEYEVEGNPKVSILIPNKDGISVLKVCIDSILEKTTYKNYEIVIIENNSEEDETFEYYKELQKNERIKVIYYKEKGFNYSRIINFGVKNSDGDYVIQLNNDTELLTENWLELMLGYCQRKDVGAVGVKLYYPDKTVQHAGVLLGLGGIAGHFFKFIGEKDFGYFSKAVMIQNMTAVTAACIMSRREIYEEVGYMNEELAVAFNDIDFCLKIRKAGYLIVYNPYVEFLHYESKTRGEENTEEKVKRFNREIDTFKKYWQKELDAGDPYYNINLRLDNDRCAIKTEKVK